MSPYGIKVLAFVFMVVIIGGLGSIKGTLISAFIVGQVVSIGSLIYARWRKWRRSPSCC